jgi:hypothetical protein
MVSDVWTVCKGVLVDDRLTCREFASEQGCHRATFSQAIPAGTCRGHIAPCFTCRCVVQLLVLRQSCLDLFVAGVSGDRACAFAGHPVSRELCVCCNSTCVLHACCQDTMHLLTCMSDLWLTHA